MPTTTSRAELGDDAPASRDRILEAALQLFAVHGFRATSVKEVMRACGLTPGALYNHFDSKDEVLMVILARAGEELSARLTQALQSAHEGPGERLHRFVLVMSEYAIRHPHETKLYNVDYAELPAEMRQRFIEDRRGNREHLERILESGIAAGEFTLPPYDGSNDVKVAATAIANLAVRLSEVVGPKPKGEVMDLARFHADLAVAMVSARPTS